MPTDLKSLSNRIAGASTGGNRYPFFEEEGYGEVVIKHAGFQQTRKAGEVYIVECKVTEFVPYGEAKVTPGAMRTEFIKMSGEMADTNLKKFCLGVYKALAYKAALSAGKSEEDAYDASRAYSEEDVDGAAVLAVIGADKAAEGLTMSIQIIKTQSGFPAKKWGPPGIVARGGDL